MRALRKMIFECVRRGHLYWYDRLFQRLRGRGDRLAFRCNVCGGETSGWLHEICGRDTPSCGSCGSNLRMRSIVHLLSLELFGQSLVLGEFPPDKRIVGLGMSDGPAYAGLLQDKFSYENTYFHKEPRLDIAQVEAKRLGRYDFVLSSDVFEHVLPPVANAFANLRQLLKGNGFAILTVPYMRILSTWEHFPGLYDFKIIEEDGERSLLNITREGRTKIYRQLFFHGGDGSTLELRIFTRRSLFQGLREGGFSEISFCRCSEPRYGIVTPINWSLPIVARANVRG